jgi:acyl-coenzyme A thioesterase PaaI-like protein
MNARFYELENGDLATVFTPSSGHQSYPNRLHGGMISAVLDESIGRAMNNGSKNFHEIWGVTIDLSVEFKKPVPYGERLVALSRSDRKSDEARKIIRGWGELYLPSGEVAAEATGRYLKLSVDKIADEKFLESDWYIIDEEDPEYIEIGGEQCS